MDTIWQFIPGILLTYTAFLLLILSPGPNVLAVMATSMSVDRSSGLCLGMGIAAGTVFWSSLSVLGLSQLIAEYRSVLGFLKLLGGAFLLWLAFNAFRSAASSNELKPQPILGGKRSGLRYFFSGFVINVANPKAALGWVAIVSLGLTSDAPWWVGIAITAGTVVLSVICHALYAILFSTAPLIALYTRARRWLQCAFGAFFTYAGLRMLISER